MKSDKKSSSHGELFGCCFGGLFLKKIHFSSQELVYPGKKQQLNEIQEPTDAPPIDPPPYSLHDNNAKSHTNSQDFGFLSCPENRSELNKLEIRAGGTSNEQYIYDHDKDTTYLLGKLLGKGGFAKCFELKDTKSQQIYAGKIISKLKLTKPKQKEKILHEISLHSTLQHHHVVNFYNSFEDDINVYIILEFCNRKSLVHVLKIRQKLTEAEVRYYLVQLMDGIKYIHSQHIVHRDLKLGNMLLNNNMHVKIADFGLATRIEFPGEKKTTVCGTPNYIAPEVLQKKGHSYEVDIWAVGCIIYALLCGRPPFETHSLKETYLRISSNRYHVPSHMSTASRRIISKLLQPDPECRPTLDQILQDDFITSFFIPCCLPSSCCEVEPKFNVNKFQGKRSSPGDRKADGTSEKNIPATNAHLNGRRKSLTRIPFVSDREGNLKSDIQRKNSLSVVTAKPLSKFQNKRIIPISQSQLSIEVAGSLVPTNFERYCKSIKMIEINKDPTKQIVVLKQQVLTNSIEKTLESKALCDNFGVSRFSAIRLYRALSHCLERMPSDTSINPLPIMQPLWVTKWVDYSNKYGFGFQLSDLSVGILFNDTTRMVLSSDGRCLTYNDLSNQTFVYSTNLAPMEHRKKVTLLLYFSQYMEEHLIHGAEFVKAQELKKKELLEGRNAQDDNVVGNVFMRKWFRTDKAIIMHLSNGTLQVNFFDDHTKLVLSVDGQDYLATYINSHRQSVSYRLLSITNFGCRNDVADRLKYARKMLEGVINLGGETV